jgi:hypothetical protein
MFKRKFIIIQNWALGSARLLSLPFMLALAGCQTIPTLPPVNLTEPGWAVRQGQVVWRSKADAPEIAGELLVAVNPDGRSFVQFTKTPLPFIVAQTTSNSWQIHIVPLNKTYSAHGRPPARLAWLHLPPCLAGAPPPKKWQWEKLENGGFRFQNPSTGELLEGYLNP